MAAGLSAYSDLIPFVMARAPSDVSAGMRLRSVHAGTRRFLIDTTLWREDLEPNNLDTDELEYTLATVSASEADILKIIKVFFRTAAEVAASEDGTEQSLNGVSYDPASGNLALPAYPASDVTDGLLVKAALVPKLNPTKELPAWVLNRFHEAFVASALVWLCGNKRKPYYDADVFKDASAEYRRLVAYWTRDMQMGRMDGSLLAQPGWSFV